MRWLKVLGVGVALLLTTACLGGQEGEEARDTDAPIQTGTNTADATHNDSGVLDSDDGDTDGTTGTSTVGDTGAADTGTSTADTAVTGDTDTDTDTGTGDTADTAVALASTDG